ncbi:hypothetical protein AB0A63_38095 [Lentzea sp. NPDC042327]|uniref:hypothetical protein n=1 Tax=Lentzea sp. NPDC042327 TaxID=3154801 RepID=UPI0033ED0825
MPIERNGIQWLLLPTFLVRLGLVVRTRSGTASTPPPRIVSRTVLRTGTSSSATTTSNTTPDSQAPARATPVATCPSRRRRSRCEPTSSREPDQYSAAAATTGSRTMTTRFRADSTARRWQTNANRCRPAEDSATPIASSACAWP